MELPLCGAAQSRDGGGCIYGAAAARGCSIEGRRGLLVWRTEKGLSVGAAAARGCLVAEGGRAVFQLRSMRTGISMAISSAGARQKQKREAQPRAARSSWQKQRGRRIRIPECQKHCPPSPYNQ